MATTAKTHEKICMLIDLKATNRLWCLSNELIYLLYQFSRSVWNSYTPINIHNHPKSDFQAMTHKSIPGQMQYRIRYSYIKSFRFQKETCPKIEQVITTAYVHETRRFAQIAHITGCLTLAQVFEEFYWCANIKSGEINSNKCNILAANSHSVAYICMWSGFLKLR